MKRMWKATAAVIGMSAMTLSSLGLPAAAAARAQQRPAPQAATLGGSAIAGAVQGTTLSAPLGLEAPFAREEVRYGARDGSPYSIQHVLELQYRLKWVGLFPGTPTGYYGTVTRNAVRAFQARRHIVVSGMATTLTWKLLLQRTVRHPLSVPATCKRGGWHACYDRTMHQVTLWFQGTLYNTWLVRGGGYTTQTRLGTHRVYYRDIDHVSGLYGSPMPYSQFFDGGEALHGSRLMMSPFIDHSHGCVNMYVEDARQLWNLTHDKPLWVTVYGAWS